MNGNSWKTWVLSVLLVLTGSLGSYAVASLDGRVQELKIRQDQLIDDRQRLAVVEAKMTNLEQQLNRVEDKIDELLAAERARRNR